jgi:hypothetical protein
MPASKGSVVNFWEVHLVVLNYRTCKTAISPSRISIPTGPLNIKSVKNLSGKTAENKSVVKQLKINGREKFKKPNSGALKYSI